jgi:hypothetical protein
VVHNFLFNLTEIKFNNMKKQKKSTKKTSVKKFTDLLSVSSEHLMRGCCTQGCCGSEVAMIG